MCAEEKKNHVLEYSETRHATQFPLLLAFNAFLEALRSLFLQGLSSAEVGLGAGSPVRERGAT